jgi:hypothetical protein
VWNPRKYKKRQVNYQYGGNKPQKEEIFKKSQNREKQKTAECYSEKTHDCFIFFMQVEEN